METYVDFQFLGQGIRVEAPGAVLEWLEEFLTPQVLVSSVSAPDRIIRFVVNAHEHRRLLEQGPHPDGGCVECFTLDHGIHSGTLWNDPDARTALDERAGVFYRCRPDNFEIDAIAAADRPGARVALMRIVREFVMMYAARAGSLLLHAAAVEIGGRAVVIAGPKHAGKTTMLLHALLHEGGRYISNDRVAIRVDGERAFVHGIPTIVSIREGTLALLPPVAAALAGTSYDFSRLLRECLRPLSATESSRLEGCNVSPRQLCHLLGVESCAGAPVSALVVLESEIVEGDSVVLHDLLIDEVTALLGRARLRPCPRSGLFSIEKAPRSDAFDTSAPLVAERVPGFRCRVGSEAYAAGSRWFGRLTKTAVPLA